MRAVAHAIAVGAVVAAMLPTATSHAYPTVILTGKTLRSRQIPAALVLPDGTFFEVEKLRARVPTVAPKDTLVYDLGNDVVLRHADQKPQDVVQRNGYRLPFLAVRTPKRPVFETPKKLGAALGKADVVIVVTEAAFLSPPAK